MSEIKNGRLDQCGPEQFGRLIILTIRKKHARMKGLRSCKKPNVHVKTTNSKCSQDVQIQTTKRLDDSMKRPFTVAIEITPSIIRTDTEKTISSGEGCTEIVAACNVCCRRLLVGELRAESQQSSNRPAIMHFRRTPGTHDRNVFRVQTL